MTKKTKKREWTFSFTVRLSEKKAEMLLEVLHLMLFELMRLETVVTCVAEEPDDG